MEFIGNLCTPVEIRNIVLFLIMYANDFVLFSKTEPGLPAFTEIHIHVEGEGQCR